MSLGKKVTLNTGAQIPYVAVPESYIYTASV